MYGLNRSTYIPLGTIHIRQGLSIIQTKKYEVWQWWNIISFSGTDTRVVICNWHTSCWIIRIQRDKWMSGRIQQLVTCNGLIYCWVTGGAERGAHNRSKMRIPTMLSLHTPTLSCAERRSDTNTDSPATCTMEEALRWSDHTPKMSYSFLHKYLQGVFFYERETRRRRAD